MDFKKKMTVKNEFEKRLQKCINKLNFARHTDMWFHGTTKERGECILQEGFKCRFKLIQEDKEPDFFKGFESEFDFVWFTKDEQEACEHAIIYTPDLGNNAVLMAKLNYKNAFNLSKDLDRRIYDKAYSFAKSGNPIFKRLLHTYNPDGEYKSGQHFLNVISNTDIKKDDGTYRNPNYKEILEILGFDSVIYDAHISRGAFSSGNAREAIGVLENDINIEGLLTFD